MSELQIDQNRKIWQATTVANRPEQENMASNNSQQMGTNIDYYALLGVPHNATAQEIRCAYYQLARQTHSDRVQGQESAVEI